MFVFVFSACSTVDESRDRAVQRARKFLLQEEKNLTLAQQEYIKFNKPVIMAAPIFPKFSTDSATSGTLSHVCIAWVLPGDKNAYVVFGAGDNRLRDWTPNRVIIKRYDPPARKYHAAKDSAIFFAMNNLLYLSDKARNIIRFEVPETIITDYKFDREKLKSINLSEEKLKSLVQITFVWRSTRPEHKLFVCGVGAKNLNGWRPIFGGETTVTELRQKFLAPISFGQNIAADGEQQKITLPQKKAVPQPPAPKPKVKAQEIPKTVAKEAEKAVKKTAVQEKTKTVVKETPVPEKTEVKAAEKTVKEVKETTAPEKVKETEKTATVEKIEETKDKEK